MLTIVLLCSSGFVRKKKYNIVINSHLCDSFQVLFLCAILMLTFGSFFFSFLSLHFAGVCFSFANAYISMSSIVELMMHNHCTVFYMELVLIEYGMHSNSTHNNICLDYISQFLYLYVYVFLCVWISLWVCVLCIVNAFGSVIWLSAPNEYHLQNQPGYIWIWLSK